LGPADFTLCPEEGLSITIRNTGTCLPVAFTMKQLDRYFYPVPSECRV